MSKKKVLFWIISLLIAVLFLVLSWKKQGFSDFYVRTFFRAFQESFGRIGGLFSFSLGEYMIYFGVVYVVFSVLLWIIRFFLLLGRSERFKALAHANSVWFVKIVILVVIVQILNCFVLYHTTPLFENTEYASYEANRDDLLDFYQMLTTRANELSVTFERDKKGEIVYNEDIKGIAKISMQGLGEDAVRRIDEGCDEVLDKDLKRLSGYYSDPKPFKKSDFFSQQYILGYYFPFSLEANYNEMMYIANYPSTMCHELSHLKGFIFEDEASFLSYLGCMNSKDPLFEYSAILNALGYVSKDVKKELALEPSLRASLIQPSELVISDSVFLTDEAWAKVESDAWFDTRKVSRASDEFLDTNLTLNGVSDGTVSYSRMVGLLLKYYYGGKING